ncbi:putative cell division cycle protein [Trypanosoma grayi]|uniref:putative cell division cycle protein n=1 Tax=Trypanosoma grayi TaxID=71804 RepID=UPI0004F46126|nr:putative cell division cycle protein [Trypanosoma grayi]KEG11542.1 putative cell division cycle protein [Trypanosoma grayi]
MNLLAIVTRSLVVVYRSTTLTVVTTLALSLKADETVVSACWSPSGRLLAIGLQLGELYLLDVESGDLVRRFVPRSGIALAIEASRAQQQQSDEFADDEDDAPAAVGGGGGSTDGDVGVGPLRQPPVLPISVDGAIVACTWTSVAPHSAALNSHKELCLPLRATVSSPILEEVEHDGDTPVMLLLDQNGGLCFLPGGLQEVCVAVVKLPWALEPRRMRVETFVVTAPPPAEKGDSSSSYNSREFSNSNNNNNNVGGGCGATSHAAYLVVEDNAAAKTSLSSLVARIPLADTVMRVAGRETVAICCIAEYCRMGRVSYRDARRRWRHLLQTVRKDLLLPQNALLLRNAVVEDVAQPSNNELLAYFRSLDLAALTKDSEELTRQFTQLVLQVSNVAYRCYDVALNMSLAQSGDRQRQCLLMDVIGGLRQRCSNFLRQMRLEADRERELVQWVAQRAALLTDTVSGNAFASRPPLRAVRHPSLLRTLHRVGRGESTTLPLVDESSAQEEDEEEEELSHIVKACLLGGREMAGHIVPLLNDVGAEEVLQRHCEVLVVDATTGGGSASVADGVQLHAVTLTQEAVPSKPLMAFYALETRSETDFFFVPQQKFVAVEMEPLQFSAGSARLLWCGIVDDEGHSVLLWERAVAASDNALVMALVSETGAVELQAEDEDRDSAATEEQEQQPEEGEQQEEQQQNLKHSILEVKGIATKHLRASVSRARGFGVFYAKERFIVVDFYTC